MNDEPYRIRLRAPWEGCRQPAADASDDRYRFRRGFGSPTGVDSDQRIWLVLERSAASETDSAAHGVQVALNGQPLPTLDATAQASRWDVTTRLLPRNELVIEYSCPTEATATTIRDAAQSHPPAAADLRDLPTWIHDVRLEITTSVKGAKQASP